MIPDRVAVAHAAAPADAAAGMQQGLEQGGLARKVWTDQRSTTRSFSRIRHGRLHHPEKLPPTAGTAGPAAPLSVPEVARRLAGWQSKSARRAHRIGCIGRKSAAHSAASG